ncbi:MAG: hypothetical protein K2I90_11430 [Odoribacter sp.]|nr:hypothetical protein [Odoribacter sp.]
MKNNKYLFLMLWAVLFGSCIDNSTELGTDKISRITIKFDPEKNSFRTDQWAEFVLPCPEIVQENEEKPLTYRWDINYKTVSTEKDLRVVCEELTPPDQDNFPCRLVVSNEDGSAFMDFTLLVTSPYQVGLVVMSKTDDGTMISFKREDKRNAEFQLDAYKLNNPDFPLGRTPVKATQVGNHLYFATVDPIRYVKVNVQTMEAVYMFPDYPVEHFDYMSGPAYGTMTLYCFADGEMIEMDGTQDSFMNFFQQMFRMFYPGARVAPKALICKSDAYFYNDTEGVLLDENASPVCAEEVFAGKKLMDCVCCNHEEEGLLIVRKEGESPEIVYVNPEEGVHYSTVSTEGTGIDETSRFVARQNMAHLYYSVGNKIFIYDYMSNANFPTTPKYTVGKSGDVIKSMLFSPDEKKFYVAYDAVDGGKLKGCVKSFLVSGLDGDNPEEELVDWDLEWEKTGIGGEIVDMIYRKE